MIENSHQLNLEEFNMTNEEFAKKIIEIDKNVGEMFLRQVGAELDRMSDSTKERILHELKAAKELYNKMTGASEDPIQSSATSQPEVVVPNAIMEIVAKNIKEHEKFVEPITKDVIDDISLLLNSTNSIEEFLSKI